MAGKDRQATLKDSSPLTTGHRWLWVPVLTGVGLTIVSEVVIAWVTKC